MTLDTEQIAPLLAAYLHADETTAPTAAENLGALAVDGPTWLILTSAIAASAGLDTRTITPLRDGNFYGVDPARAETSDIVSVVSNQIIAAAANHDVTLVHDLLATRLLAALDADPTSVEQQTCAHILSYTMHCARLLHQTRCSGATQ